MTGIISSEKRIFIKLFFPDLDLLIINLSHERKILLHYFADDSDDPFAVFNRLASFI